jgi:hypothetical protein
MKRRELMLLLGGAMTAPRALRAQQKARLVIGYLSSESPGPSAPFVPAGASAKPDTSRDKMWRSNTDGRRGTMIGWPH